MQEVFIEEVLIEAEELTYTRKHYLIYLRELEGEGELEVPCSQRSQMSLGHGGDFGGAHLANYTYHL